MIRMYPEDKTFRVYPPAIMRKREVADACSVSERTVHVWIKKFGLKAWQRDGLVLITRRDLFRFLRAR